ncbi:hypothetical protein IKE84_01880 [Candidatus Saccharibacteria bacterium]|nr:hypothetical protein [Candidatus Saccharibacteria bacterium]
MLSKIKNRISAREVLNRNGLTLKGHQRWIVSVVSVFLLAFVAAFVASSVFAPQSITNADTLYFYDDEAGYNYTTSVKSADNVVINMEATPSGNVAIAHDTVTTITNNPDGYQLYFSMDRLADYDAAHPGNALYKDGNTTASQMLKPTAAAASAPAVLDGNTWGFAIPTGQTGVPSAMDNFDSTYSDTSASMNKFAFTPLRSSAVKVQERSGSATTTEGDSLEVYYGAKANLAVGSGQYTGTVNYFVISDTSISSFDTIAVNPTVISPNGGEDLTIVTSLHTNYAFTSSDINVTITSKTDSSNSKACTITDINSDTGNVNIACTTPAMFADGDYEVEVEIPSYGKDWTTDITVASPTPTFWNITYMQEMTKNICNSVTTPAKTAQEEDTNGSHAGSSAYVPTRTLYDWRGKDGTGSITNKVAPNSSNAQTYTIRKLADGNCWMTENLNLPLYKNYTTPGMNTSSSLTAQPVEVADVNGNIVSQSRTDNVYGNITSAGIWTPVKASNLTNNDNTYALNGNTAYNVGNTGTAAAWNNIWYYSWSAATAGSGTASLVTSSGDAQYSICPKGWRLPTNYTNSTSTSAQKSWGSLLNTYGINPANHSTTSEYQILEAFPFNLPRAGFFEGGAFQNNGSGYWWSSTAHSTATHAYLLTFYTAVVYPQHYNLKYRGFNVRCVSAEI